MKKDSVIKDIVSDIQSQAKDRFKINLTESTIYEVIEWQFKEVADAMKELEEIRLPFFGTFVPKSNKGQKIEKSPIREFILTDTVPMRQGVKSKKIQIISGSKIIGESIRRIFNEESISSLFVNHR